MHMLMKPQQWYSVALVFRQEGASGGSSSAGESIGAEQKRGLLFCCSALFIFSRKTCRKKTPRQEIKASSECVCMHTGGTDTEKYHWKKGRGQMRRSNPSAVVHGGRRAHTTRHFSSQIQQSLRVLTLETTAPLKQHGIMARKY